MKYFETKLSNDEKEEIIIRPVYAPIMVKLRQSHYGDQKYVLFPGDIARLNVSGLENNNNFYYWKQDKNYYSIHSGFKYAIVRKENMFYLFETDLHDGYLDTCKLVKVMEIETDNAIKEFYELLVYVDENILHITIDKKFIAKKICIERNLVKLPREMKRNEDLRKYYDEMEEEVLKIIEKF